MTRKDVILQYAAALLVFLILSLWIRAPGYMDAEYYTLSAIQLAGDKGLTQPILWNYLDDPAGIPHPSHTYWMPAPSLTAAAAMRLTGTLDFSTGRLPFIFMAALAAPAAGWMGYRFSHRRLIAWLAAGFATFPGYYAPYSTTVDSFFLVMAGAWLLFYCLDRISQKEGSHEWVFWLLAGMASGWLHLNRADGFLWLGLVVLVWGIRLIKPPHSVNRWYCLPIILSGYLLLTGFWYYRNLMTYGSLFIPGSSRALWMTSYNELFTFPADSLTYRHWAASGFAAIMNDRLGALASNLMSMVAVQGLVLLLPLWLVSVWKRRHDPLVRASMGMELVILLVMSLVFPYSGKRGGFLHSSAALQPVIWGLAAAGLVDVINWAALKRRWNADRAVKLFAPGLVVLCGLVTLFVFRLVVIGDNPQQAAWEESYRRAVWAQELAAANQVPANTRIMINNPAGFGLVSGREALVIPNGGPETTLAVAKKFQAGYLLLEKNMVAGLFPLYRHPEEFPQFSVIDKREDLLLLKINPIESTAP